MAPDEPIRLTAEEAQQIITVQRAEIKSLRDSLYRCLQSIERLGGNLKEEMSYHTWLKDYGSGG